ncbi:MAG: hypothetical protein ACM32E_08420 [Gemmatimonadota bacterium]
MAPPIPRSRPPAASRRTVTDVLIGAAAVLALALLTAGVPAALVMIFGLPVPHSLPSLSAFSRPLDIFTILKILSVVVWLAWVQLILCLIAEIRAAVRNTGMPGRVPLAGGTQALVHRLVTAALLLASVSAAISPALTHAPARAPHVAAAQAVAGPQQVAVVRAGPQAGPDGVAPAAQAGPESHVQKIYVVQPPEGRYHESLWEIAEKHLGDGRRYREIFELNRDRVQPDGSKLTIASLIRPGWVLHMPRDAHGPGIEVVSGRPHAPAAGAAGGAAQGGHGTAHGGQQGAGGTAGAAGGAGGAGAGGSGARGSGTAGGGLAAAHTQPGQTFPDELAAAGLLAAGLLSALGRRRREQLWRRAFGSRLPVPDPAAAAAEAALRLGASEPSVRLLDQGLRYLSRALAEQGHQPPTVFAAHIGEQNLDLWVAPADRNAPAPWQAVGDGEVWRLARAAASQLDPERGDSSLAPYPGLVSIGTDATGRVLVDLESAHGLIAITGEDGQVAAVLAAMAAELATNCWSDQMHITLVGFGEELTGLAPGRVTTAPSLAEALPMLEERAAAVERALAETGVGSVLTGRSRGLRPEAWAPHYLISAVPPSGEERERLLALARTRHAAAAGYVVAGEVQGATWTWEVSASGRMRAGLLGFDVEAQLLPARQYAAVVELFRAAGQAGGEELGPLPPDAAPAEQLDPGSVMPVEITLLGQVAVTAPGPLEPERRALATELVVYLAAHPGGVHPNVLAGAIWPRGVTTEVREAALARVVDWLGTDDIGRPHLASDASGRLRLGSQVRVDWQVFRALAGRASLAAAGDGAAAGETAVEEAALLARALDLVQGQLLDGRDPGRYAWLATDDLEYEVSARVADAAHRLCGLRLAASDPRGAMAAARQGLRLAFNDELLWRDLLRAAKATGEPQVLREVVAEACARTALDQVLPRMAPETEALIDELLPSWRSSVA